MITNIYIDNFLGISSPIEMSFLSKSRGKDDNESIYKTEDDIYINKIIGIIGGNASGKTSILTALNVIGLLLIQPILQYNIEDKLKELKTLFKEEANAESQEILGRIIDNYKSSVDIRFQNVNRKNDDTSFKIEIYIDNDNEKLKGYYTYEIVINGIDKCIEKEVLSFRNKYKGKNKEIVNITNAKEGQVYYINRYFKNISDINLEKKVELEEKYEYINTFINHYVKKSSTIYTDSNSNYKKLRFIDWYRNSPKVFTNLAKIVDSKIDDVIIDSNGRQERLMFVLKNGSKITRNLLSTGTDRFLNLIRYVNECIENRGVLIVDEIEQNLHKELVELIINLYNNTQSYNSQILFTTLSPEIFDLTDENNKKIFKQDMVYILDGSSNNIKIDRLMDLKIDGKRVKGDASVTNLYNLKKISIHPNDEQIKEFLKEFKNGLL